MKKHNPPLIRIILSLTVLVGALVLPVFMPQAAAAAQITSRRLTLLDGTSDGGSKPGGVVKHSFEFTVPTGGNVGSILFQYCTIASGTCTTPSGLVTTSATLGNETGATGFSMVNTTNGAPYLTRTAANIPASTAVSYRFDTVTNPTATNTTFFVRISTYVSTDTSGSAVDNGTVAASTATQIALTGTMPESLVFCTGATVSTTSGVPDCATATAGTVSFNQLFSPTDTATATSQMAASTNAGSGYTITVAGATLTSGANTISALSANTASIKGLSQFGLNLKLNTVAASNPAVGTEVAPLANGTNYKGQAAANYTTADSFRYVSGETVANSYNVSAGASDAQIFTVAYIVNVPGSQAAGTYTTTLTYVCTPTF